MMNKAAEIAFFLLRVVAGFLIWQSGAVILLGWFGGMPEGQAVKLLSQTRIGGILEFAGGIAVALGLFTRVAAFLLSGTMAVAYWQFHAPFARWPLQNQGLPAVLFCFIFLYIAARGGGKYSLDALIWRKARGS
jgi:putative oxidoreductase